jgi:hypothetical protein
MMATTEYTTCTTTTNSLETTSQLSSSHGGDNYDDMEGGNGQQGPEDFVAPPSCWFDSTVAAAAAAASNKNVTSSALTESLDSLESQEHEQQNNTERQNQIQQQTDLLQQRSSPPQREITIPAITRLSTPPLLPPIPNGVDVIVVGNTRPSPSWREISSQVLPAAAKELLSSSIRRLYYTAKISYSRGRWQKKYSDMGHNAGGFSSSSNIDLPPHLSQLPPFSSLPWIDRQLVNEWRTYLPETPQGVDGDSEDFDFEQARTLIPNLLPKPTWKKADVCYNCHKPFGPVRLRHHCRSCGQSFCQDHSMSIQRLPHLGYDDVPERVCDICKTILEEQNLAERVAWRLARCRDYKQGCLTPYFETGIDSVEEIAIRVTNAAIAMAKSIPLGAQATVAVETVNVLRKYGLHGIYGIMLRKEFLAAADLLRQALGINKSSWPLSVHELSAAIFYALAQHRAMRGLSPEREHTIHRFRSVSKSYNKDVPPPLLEELEEIFATEKSNIHSTIGDVATRHVEKNETTLNTTASPIVGVDSTGNKSTNIPVMVDRYELSALDFHNSPVIDETDTYNPVVSNCVNLVEELHNKTMYADPRRCVSGVVNDKKEHERTDNEQKQDPLPTFTPVCDPVPDSVLASLVFYAPIALNFIYATKEVEMQLLAAQQGWRLLYAYLNQDTESFKPCDRPASAVFLHQQHKIVCLSIRGTATINDVITDIRQIPVPFPETDPDHGSENNDGDWTNIYHGQGLALCGMASAAENLFHEHIDSLLHFAKQGYRIRLVGHSLGGGVATMLGVLVLRHFEQFGYSNEADGPTLDDRILLKVYSYGAPSCFDAKLADSVKSFVTTVVLHDDVFPRLTPTSCRGLLKHLLHIRETWVEANIEEDLRAVGERAKTAWAPRFRQNLALRSSTSSIKKYCKKQILKGKSKLLSVQNDTMRKPSGEDIGSNNQCIHGSASRDDYSDCGEIESLTSDPSEWGEKFFVPATKVSMTNSYEETTEEEVEDNPTQKPDEIRTQSLLEFLGGGDTQTEGLIIDGEEFFEAGESLVDSCDDGSESKCDECFSDPIHEIPDEASLHTSDSWSLDMHGSESPPSKNSMGNTDENGPAAVVLDESPLPRMFIPGKVIHVYSHRGVYRAAYVPRTFKELRRISLAGNMLSNHTAKSYFEGLLEVQTVRVAQESPPIWTAYDEDDTCCCCANRFTWASTSDSEAQEARDKHNCRSCGGLICDPCSMNRVPISSIGLTVPVRVCDRCYNDIMGGVSAASSPMTSSILAGDEDERTLSDCSSASVHEEVKEKPERRRQKRSVVVDDLVSQMRSSALT